MGYRIGDEFRQVADMYLECRQGEGTHIWDGEKIVPKAEALKEQRKKKKTDK